MAKFSDGIPAMVAEFISGFNSKLNESYEVDWNALDTLKQMLSRHNYVFEYTSNEWLVRYTLTKKKPSIPVE